MPEPENPLYQDIQPDCRTFNPHVPSVEDPETKERLYLTLPPTELRDLALGRVIDAFGHLESALYLLLDRLLGLGTMFEARDVFYNILDAHKLRDTITNLSSLRLSKEYYKVLDALLDRARDITTKRNRIVHAQWQPHYIVRNEPDFRIFAYWERSYRPTNPREREELNKKPPDPRIYAKYCFCIKNLHEISDHVMTLSADFHHFLSSIDGQLPKQLPPPLPQGGAGSPQEQQQSDPPAHHQDEN